MKKIIDYLKSAFENSVVFNFLTRYGIVIGLLVICITIITVPSVIEFLLTITALECLALLLSGLAMFAYTHIQFTKKLSFGDDEKASATESYAFQRVLGNIFIGVHILVSIGSMLYYSDMFTKI